MNEVDKRVVQMEFDNKKFEQNVSETIKSLQALDEALKLDSASTDGLDKTAKSAKKLESSMDGVTSAVEETTLQFSALQVIGATALFSLTNAAISAGTKMVRAFNKPLSMAISGGIARSQNIENAKFMLEGLGVAWKDIADDINYGVKGTAYGLDAAAKVASQLVASNVELGDNMRTSLRAISGVAAMTNSTYEDIGAVFTTVAGQGKLMTMQLRQLEARGLNVAATLGKAMNKTEAEIRDMVTNGKISFQDFANAMDEAFGEHAKDANKTFAGALSNTKAALSRLGEAFATPTFEMFKDILNSIIPIIDKINVKLKPIVALYSNFLTTITETITKVLESKDFTDMMDKAAMSMYTWIAAIRAALRLIGIKLPDLNNGVRGLAYFFDKLTLSGDKATMVVKSFMVLFQTIKLINTVVRALFRIAYPFLNLAVQILGRIFGISGDFYEIIFKIEDKLIRIIDVVSRIISSGLIRFLSTIVSLLANIAFDAIILSLNIIFAIITSITSILAQLAKIIFVIVATLGGGASYALYGIFDVFSDILGGADKLSDIVRSVFGKKKKTTLTVDSSGLPDPEVIRSTNSNINNVNKTLDSTNKKVSTIGKTVKKTSADVSNLNSVAKEAGKQAENSLKTVSDSLTDVKSKVNDIHRDNDGSVGVLMTPEEIEANENTPTVFERFFINVKKVLDAGVKVLNLALSGVVLFITNMYKVLVNVIKWVFDRLSDFLDGLNWVKVALAAISAVILFTVYETLRAVDAAITALASVGYLAKGYADRAAAAKFAALTTMILAFGAVCTVLMVVINSVDTDKLNAGVDALIRLAVKIGTLVIAFTVIQGVVSIFQSISAILNSLRMLSNVGHMQLIISPIKQLFLTVSQILMVIFGSIIAFELLFGGEGGWKKFGSAVAKVGIILLATLGILIGFTLIMWNVSKGFYEFSTVTQETGKFLHKHKSKVTNDPLESMANFLSSIMPYFKMLFTSVIAFAVLEKLFGHDTIDKAVKDVLKIFGIGAAILGGLIIAIGVLQGVTLGRKADPNKLEKASLYIASITEAIKAFSSYVKSLFTVFVGFIIIRNIADSDDIQAAWVSVILTLGLAFGSIYALLALVNKYNNAFKPNVLNSVTTLLNEITSFIKSIAISVAELAIISKLTGGENVAVALGALFTIMLTMLIGINATINNLDGMKIRSAEFEKRVKSIDKLIKKGIIPLVSSLTILIATIAIVTKISGMNTSGRFLSFIFGIAALLISVAGAFAIIIAASKDLTKSKLEKVQGVLTTISAVLTAMTGNMAILAGLVVIFDKYGNLNSFLKLAAVFGMVAIIISVVSIAMYKMVKNAGKFTESNINKISKIIIQVIGLSMSMVGLMTAVSALLLVINKSNISGTSIGIATGIFAVVTILVATITAVMIQLRDKFPDARELKNVLISFTAAIGILASIVGIAAAIGSVGKQIENTNLVNVASLITFVIGALLAIAVAFAVAAKNMQALTAKNVIKTIAIFTAMTGTLVILTVLIDSLAVTAAKVENVKLKPMLKLTAILAIFVSIFTAMASFVGAFGKHVASIIAATIAFGALIVFFQVFSRAIIKMSDALEILDKVSWRNGYAKLAAIYGIFVGVFAIITLCYTNFASGIAISLATLVMQLLTSFFEGMASAIYQLAMAADMAQNIDTRALLNLVETVIFDILPMLTKEVLDNINNFVKFITDISGALNQLDKLKNGRGGTNLEDIFSKLQVVADSLPTIAKAFRSVDNSMADKITKISGALAALLDAVSSISGVSKSNILPSLGESLKQLFENLSTVNTESIDKLTNSITAFKDVLHGLPTLLLSVAAALFVASLIFDAAFASLAIGPIGFVAALTIAFAFLSGSDGPLGSFSSFVDGLIGEGDTLLQNVLRIVFGIGDAFDKLKVTLAGMGILAGLGVGAISGGPLAVPIVLTIASVVAADSLGTNLGQIITDLGLFDDGFIGGLQRAALLLSGNPMAPYVRTGGGTSEDIRKMEAISDDSSYAIELLSSVHGDLSELSNDELKFALDAFTKEYEDGVVQEGEQRDTMLELMNSLYDQLVKNGELSQEKPYWYDTDKAMEMISEWDERGGSYSGDWSVYSQDELKFMRDAYRRQLEDDDTLTFTQQQYYQRLIDSLDESIIDVGESQADYYREQAENQKHLNSLIEELEKQQIFTNKYLEEIKNNQKSNGVFDFTDLSDKLNSIGDSLQNIFSGQNGAIPIRGIPLNGVNSQLANVDETMSNMALIGDKIASAMFGDSTNGPKEIVKRASNAIKGNNILNGSNVELPDWLLNLGGNVLDILGDVGDKSIDYLAGFISSLGDMLGIDISSILDSIHDLIGDEAYDKLSNIFSSLSGLSYDGGELSAEEFNAGFLDALGDTIGQSVVNAFNDAMKQMGQGLGQAIAAMEAAVPSSILNNTETGAGAMYAGLIAMQAAANAKIESGRSYYRDFHEKGAWYVNQKLEEGEYDWQKSHYYTDWLASQEKDTVSGPSTTSGLSNDISKSSGAGSGIGDKTKGGVDTGSNITNIDSNNVTYNYTQNNYSPEALNRTDIYRQTNNQLKTVFDALKG